MQQPTGRGAARPPIGIAFDGDAGNRIDAVLAIAMLNGMTAKTQARRISLSVSRPSLASAQVADVVAAFYRGRPVAGPGGGIGQASEGMIGLPESKTVSAYAPPFAAILSSKAADGTPNYRGSATEKRRRAASPFCLLPSPLTGLCITYVNGAGSRCPDASPKFSTGTPMRSISVRWKFDIGVSLR